LPFWAELLSRWALTTHSGQRNRSPTVLATTTLNPAPLSVEDASLYFWPVTVGDAPASGAPNNASVNTSMAALTQRLIGAAPISVNLPQFT
jgi:hypothetical protein